MAGCRKSAVSSHSPHRNPLIENRHHHRSSTAGVVSLGTQIRRSVAIIGDNKENSSPNCANPEEKLNRRETADEHAPNSKPFSNAKAQSKNEPIKKSSLQSCMKKHEPDSDLGLKIWDEPYDSSEKSGHLWDHHSDSEAAPAPPWSTLPNRSLLFRPLPVDVGRCTCIIVKESSPNGFDGGTLYTLYTNEGKGRRNRKLAVARHRRRKGRSEFTVAQNVRGIVTPSDESLIGTMNANIVGTKYHIWDQGDCRNSLTRIHPKLLASVSFAPTVSTWTGNYRSMRAWIPKHQSMQLKNTNQVQQQHMNGLPMEWENNKDRVHQLFSKIPSYNKYSKQYELDYRDRGRGGGGGAGYQILSSMKNFQLTLERNGKQTILQLGRVGKSQYLMDYRYPMSGYQAFCICLASIDSKLCCSV
ncbi:tubby-like protein 8 [Andrographis paniculata]|uniref:tubby-like protein 8 n=1 Tax=Andrographis paniculata TaxID=175694 RepID=UPI0021E8430E|nr:tubby-like protein 8 [Andrographis paniculata]